MQIAWLEWIEKHFLDTDIHVYLRKSKNIVTNMSNDIISTFMKEVGYHFDIEHSPMNQENRNEVEILVNISRDTQQKHEKKWFMWKWFKKNFGNKPVN